MEYRLTPASSLNCEVILVGRQADASAMEKPDNRLHHEGQYLWRTFETKREHLPFIQFPLPFKSKEFLDLGIHGDMEEGIFKIQPLGTPQKWTTTAENSLRRAIFSL